MPVRALSLYMQAMEEIVHAAQALDMRPDVKALIITGDGVKYFAAGADIKEMADQTYDEVNPLSTIGCHGTTSPCPPWTKTGSPEQLWLRILPGDAF